MVEVARRGDTVRVSYVLRNSPGSKEDLWEFTVAAPTPVVRITAPTTVPVPGQEWRSGTRYGDRSVAVWNILGPPHLPPGSTSPVLWFEAIGLPAPVTSWTGGWFPLPQHVPSDTAGVTPQPVDVLDAYSVRGATVGVEPFPEDTTALGLLDRLRGLLPRVCGDLGWISNRGICTGLEAKLDNARRSLARGDRNSAGGQLGAVVNQLDAQRGKHVMDNAYWLLKVNAEIVLERL